MEEDVLIEKGLELTYNSCQTEFTNVPTASIAETELFIQGEHWMNQAGWIGWKPESASKSAVSTMLFIEQAFTPKNVIGGVINRLKGAVAGQQPDFAIVPKEKDLPDAEREVYKTMDSQLNDWFTRKDVHEEIKKFVHNRKAHGKASLRIHVPIGLLQKDGDTWKVPAKDFASALDYIYVTAHDADKCVDGKDVRFGEKYAIVKLEGNINPSDSEKVKAYQFEVSFVNKEKKTVVRTINQDESDKQIVLDLGGNPLVMVKGDYKDAMISKPIKAMQKRVNCAKTNEGLAGDNINFPETTFIDVELPTEAVLQPNGKYKEQVAVKSGMGVFRSFLSRIIQDAEGGDRAVQGQMITRAQADPAHFAKIADNNTRDIHQSLGMLYIYLADSEYASGDAKIEAMADYLILLIDSKTELDVVGSWIGNTVTRLAMRFSGDEQLKDKFTFTYSSKLTLGKLTVEERKLMLDEVKMLLRSRRSYQVNGTISDDPDKEDISILEEIAQFTPELKELAYGLKQQIESKTPTNQPPKPTN